MRYALYGADRVAKDFLYIFADRLDIRMGFAAAGEDSHALDGAVDIPFHEEGDIGAYSGAFDTLIVCGFDTEAMCARLRELGYGDRCQPARAFFLSLDPFPLNPEHKEILLWGAGRRGEKFLRWNKAYPIEAVIDSQPQEESLFGLPVKRPAEIADWSRCFVIVAVLKNREIIDFLEGQGLVAGRDFVLDKDVEGLPSAMLEKTMFQREVYDFSCETMLNHAEVGRDGEVICCCSTFIIHSLGKAGQEHSFAEGWNSIRHRIMCLSNVNRTYSFCLTDMCPLFIGKGKGEDYALSQPYPEMEPSPRTVAVGFDYTCNLKCVTCRKDFAAASGVEQEEIQACADMVRKEVLPGCEFLIMAGDGEVLLSKAYRSLYTAEEIRHLKWLRLLSNGLLFTPQKWQEIRSYTDAAIMMTVSIDAATAETYAKIRRGGRFETLEKNMAYAASLRRKGELSYLRFNFVVQRENYREMPAFAEWGLRLGIDEVFFTKILNWGTYTREAFKSVSMMEEDGITPKWELQEILDQPIMSEPIVDLGTIRDGSREMSEEPAYWQREIKNYYRWELERRVPGLFGGR